MEDYNTLSGLSDDDLKSISEGLSKKQKERMIEILMQGKNEETENNVEKSEIPQELKDFREAWKKKWNTLPAATIEKIVNAAEKINVKVETDKEDGSRLIKFSLNWKKYKILDPKLMTHSDQGYLHKFQWDVYDTVYLSWMLWDDKDRRKNKKLAEYVKEKEKERLHIAKIEELQLLLFELCKQADLDLGDIHGKIGMLSYLTWMDGNYWLSMWTNTHSWDWSSRSRLTIDPSYADFYHTKEHEHAISAGLCMIDIE